MTTYAYDTCPAGATRTYAFPHTVQNALSDTTTYTQDCGTGRPSSIQGPNDSVVTSLTYGDALDRLTEITRPDGGQTQYTYPMIGSALPQATTVQNDLYVPGDVGVRTDNLTDGLGRTVETIQGSVYSKRDLDALGRVRNVYNPAFGAPGTCPTSCTTYTYDGLNRTTNVAYADGSSETISYNGDEATSTDAAGKTRTQDSDALGRIVKVTEDPTGLAYQTTYVYDILDDLTTVTQGAQTRNFGYNSVKDLISATNPEVGSTAITYAYDNDGNLKTKTAPGVTITYSYDALERVVGRSYSDGTPTATFCYDGKTWDGSTGCTGSRATPNLGYVTQTGSTGPSASSMSYSHGALGRVATSTQNTGAVNYGFQYHYTLTGAVKSEKYPSGRTITTTYDGGGSGWATQVAGTLGTASSTYAGGANSDIKYEPTGALRSMSMFTGSGLVEQRCYNNRLQAAGVRVGTALNASPTDCSDPSNGDLLNLNLSYAPGGNNGSPYQQTIQYQGPGEPLQAFTQNYTSYDQLNRLAGFGEGSVSQTYGHDAYGNHWVSANAGYALSPLTPMTQNWFNASNNRIVSIGYDARGNQTQINPYTMTYDGDDHQASAVSVSNGSASYEYDAEGHRVRKLTCMGNVACTNGSPGLATTVFVYDAMSHLIAEYSTAGASGSGTELYTTDQLGSTRLVVDGTGKPKRRYDYLPYGEELWAGVNGRSSLYPSAPAGGGIKFTGQMRDGETGLDWFGTRYLSSAQDRFTGPDEPLFDQHSENPQSWNLYGYVRNNPLANLDPTGRDCIYAGGLANDGTVEIERGDFCSRSGGNYYNGTVDINSLVYNPVAGTLNLDYGRVDNNGATIVNTTLAVVDPGLDGLAAFRLAGQISAPVSDPKDIAAFYGLSALGGLGLYAGGALAGGEGVELAIGSSAVTPTSGQVSYAARLAAEGGRRGLQRALATLERRLAEHLTKLGEIKQAGGYSSSVEREIANFRGQIEAIRQALSKLP
jgi:RHS repeat-associated protein